MVINGAIRVISTSIGVNANRVLVTKNITMVIKEATSVTATVSVTESKTGRIAMDAIGFDKLIAQTNEKMGRVS